MAADESVEIVPHEKEQLAIVHSPFSVDGATLSLPHVEFEDIAAFLRQPSDQIFTPQQLVDSGQHRYAGGVKRSVYDGWAAVIRRKSYSVNKTFAAKSFGGCSRTALAAAETFRRMQSNRAGLTEYMVRDVPETLSSSMTTAILHSPHTVAEYAAGFVDGDGCIVVYDYNISVVVGVSSGSDASPPSVLTFLQSHYGGTIRLARGQKGNHRPTWYYGVFGGAAVPLLHSVATYGIIKREQAAIALPLAEAMIRTSDHPRCNTDDMTRRKEAVPLIAGLKEPVAYATVTIDPTRLTWPYLSGLFDAEGCIIIYRGTVQLSIAQSSCPRLLTAIRAKLHCGTANLRQFQLYGADTLAVLQQIQPFSTVKLSQITAVLDSREALPNPKKRHRTQIETAAAHSSLEDLSTRLKILKRL